MNGAHKFQRLTGTFVLACAMMVSLQRCATTPRPPFAPMAAAEVSVPAAESPRSTEVVLRAISLVGTPYHYGGSQPTDGLDCSGLVYYVYSGLGIDVPRTVHEQLMAAKRVTMTQLQPGDLLFFKVDGTVSHVGIYVGEGRFVHAPRAGKSVRLTRLHDSFYRPRLVGVGRFD